MQNQLTSGQTSLQQQVGSSLQQNNSNLQQSGSPATSSNVFTTLSQDAPAIGLQVQSAQTDPGLESQTYVPGISPVAWIVPLAFAFAVIAAAALWVRVRNQLWEEVTPIIKQEPEVIKKTSAVTKKPKSAKKTTRRKRQAKR